MHALTLALLLLASPFTLVGRATSHGHAHGGPSPDVSTQPARASFSVHFPWATRKRSVPSRTGLEAFYPFCGEWVHNPQPFSGYKRTFLSFSGNAGDLGAHAPPPLPRLSVSLFARADCRPQ